MDIKEHTRNRQKYLLGADRRPFFTWYPDLPMAEPIIANRVAACQSLLTYIKRCLT